MPHVDDAQLHAYLDTRERDGGSDPGEVLATERHLGECAECRKRLADVRSTRERAQTILDSSPPLAVDTPPFEGVLRRARGASEARRPGMLTTPLAWAATVALALGVGWYARELAIAPRPEEGPVALMEESGSRASTQVGVGGIREQRREVALSELEEKVTVDDKRTPAAAPPVGAIAQAEPELAQSAQPRGRAAGPPVVAGVDAPQGGKGEAVARLIPAEAQDRLAERREMDEAPAAAAKRVAAAENAAPPVRQLEDLDGNWVPSDRRAAEEHVGGAILTIPGIGEPAFEIRTSGAPAVRTRQAIGRNLNLELVQTRTVPPDIGLRSAVDVAGRARDAAARDQDDSAGIVTEVGEYSVWARAPISRDSLETLLRRLQ